MFKENPDFYPTPEVLADRIVGMLDFDTVFSVLEPSAGKGDLVKAIMRKADSQYRNKDIDIDCIERDANLRSLLCGSGYKVIHDDFLTFDSLKNYDAIVMNPPFSEGARHLLKAIDILKYGGQIVCILNAETLKNAYTNERKLLLQRLDELKAQVVFEKEQFTKAERPCAVEIAIICCKIEKKFTGNSFILDNLKKARETAADITGANELNFYEYVQRMVANFNFEAQVGLKLIREFESLKPYMINSFKENSYKYSLLELKVEGKDNYYYTTPGSKINAYLRGLRYKYWDALSNSEQLARMMTSNLQQLYYQKISELRNYDFTIFNIEAVNKMLMDNMAAAVSDTIMQLFEKLSAENSWYSGSKNIHYYNGWSTNKAHKVNDKVIIWADAYSNIFNSFRLNSHGICSIIQDIEKTLNYLDMGQTSAYEDILQILSRSEKMGESKNIRAKYFSMTFYKKGTCHLTFHCPTLLKKLNIYASQKKGWLPPSYGKKLYEDMTPEEQRVIDEFEGRESYADTLKNKEYYLPEGKMNLISR